MQKCNNAYRLAYSHDHWKDFREGLQEIAKGGIGLPQLIAILKKHHRMTDGEASPRPSFKVLQQMEVSSFKSVLSLMAAVASYILKHEQAPLVIPVVQPNINREYKLTKRQIVLLMCLMAMCLTIRPTYAHADQTINFSVFFDSQKHKSQAVISYLDIVLGQETDLEQPLVIKRSCDVSILDTFSLLESDKKLGEFELLANGTNIEEFNGLVKIDFANAYLGGGALDHGCVQEQIMFICHPELLATMLICPKMENNEAIGLLGFRKYFKTEGYRDTMQFAGLDKCKYNRLPDGTLEEYIVAIDATYRKNLQFTEEYLLREIVKARAGFNCFEQVKTIVSGNWGCGAFGGNLHAKLIIQWIVTTLLSKKLLYCPFNRKEALEPVYLAAKNLTVGQAFEILHSYEKCLKEDKKLDQQNYPFLKHLLKYAETVKK